MEQHTKILNNLNNDAKYVYVVNCISLRLIGATFFILSLEK